MLSRRGFLAGLGAATAPVPGWAAAGSPIALSCAATADGAFVLTGIKADGSLAFTIPLPARGHAGAAHPTFAEAVVIARRPGDFALIINCVDGSVTRQLKAPKGRHFYGHGTFSADGTLFFTTENAFETGEGRIGVWDVALGYERLDEFTSEGIGPHEIIRLKSGALAVANGGIRTHPASGREKLNLDTMRSNLSLFDTNGRLFDQFEANAQLSSLRHIAEVADGGIAVGYQWQGDPFEPAPLIGLAKNGIMTDFDDPEITRSLNAYVGSVASHPKGLAATSPRGGKLVVFDAFGQSQLSLSAMDICGLAMTGGSVIATDGFGTVFRLDREMHRQASHALLFDNHLIGIAA
ncbi:MAG: DUF1513 domain-containing protein [Pseudomonadota bacterium]